MIDKVSHPDIREPACKWLLVVKRRKKGGAEEKCLRTGVRRYAGIFASTLSGSRALSRAQCHCHSLEIKLWPASLHREVSNTKRPVKDLVNGAALLRLQHALGGACT